MVSAAQERNSNCIGDVLDRQKLLNELSLLGLPLHDAQTLAASGSNLFADLPVFVSPQNLESMQATIESLWRILPSPGIRAHLLAQTQPQEADPVRWALAHQAPASVLFGVDFHLSDESPKLIEINTNAGGALLSLAADRAHGGASVTPHALDDIVQSFITAAGKKPHSVAIVDDGIGSQFLSGEFHMMRAQFAAQGIAAVVVEASELTYSDGRLWAAGHAIDLVYNRLTDFYFEEPRHAALRRAFEEGTAVITPNPLGHALFARKTHLELLSEPAVLETLAVAPADIAVMGRSVPRTLSVEASQAEKWWAERKQWFFKPVAGYGSKGAYRGDKLTKRVFEEILKGGYVAQELVLPSERAVPGEDGCTTRRLDIRAYVFEGKAQLWSTRLYSGQTTNFRTPHGGFAPVRVVG